MAFPDAPQAQQWECIFYDHKTVETIYLNSYNMKNETEIRMNDNAFVEFSYIIIQGEKCYIGGSFLLDASSDKYNKNREKW